MEKYTTTVPQMWSVKEAAQNTNTATSFIRRLLRENKIKYIKTGKKFLINAKSLCDFLDGCDK